MSKIVYKGKEINLEDYIILMLDRGYSDIIEEVTLPDSTTKGKWKNYIKSENILINKDKIEEYKEIINNHKDKVQDYKDYVDAIEPVEILKNNKIKKSKKQNKVKRNVQEYQQNMPENLSGEIDFTDFQDFDQLNALLDMQNNIPFQPQIQREGIPEEERMRIRQSIAKQLTDGTYFETSGETSASDNFIEARRKRSASGKNRMNFTGSNNIEELKQEKIENQYKDKSEEEVIRIKRNKNQVLNQMFSK